MPVRSWGQEDPLEEDKATHSSLLPWRAPWTEEPGGLQSMGLQRVGHDRSDLTRKHAPYCSGRWSGWVIDVISHCDRFIVMKATGTWLKGTGNCDPHFMVSVYYWPRTKLPCAQECSDWGSFSQNWQRKWPLSRRHSIRRENTRTVAKDTRTYGMSHHSSACSSVTAWVIGGRRKGSLKSRQWGQPGDSHNFLNAYFKETFNFPKWSFNSVFFTWFLEPKIDA